MEKANMITQSMGVEKNLNLCVSCSHIYACILSVYIHIYACTYTNMNNECKSNFIAPLDVLFLLSISRKKYVFQLNFVQY